VPVGICLTPIGKSSAYNSLMGRSLFFYQIMSLARQIRTPLQCIFVKCTKFPLFPGNM